MLSYERKNVKINTDCRSTLIVPGERKVIKTDIDVDITEHIVQFMQLIIQTNLILEAQKYFKINFSTQTINWGKLIIGVIFFFFLLCLYLEQTDCSETESNK